jgi:thiol-disulfide isomerase/thioredoxin
LPFNAELVSENKYRFQNMPLPPIANISGTYDAVFTDENGIDSTVGIFKQSGNHLTGTFLTKTGDYRFLEGEVSADSFFLSAFDGSHAFLFKGKIHDEVTLTGHFWSGKHYHATFTAKRNDQAKLPDAKKLTYLKEGYTKIDFRFPDENGKMVSLTDEQFTNKPVILLITGSWCPNCMDEAAYMSQVEETYRNTDLRIVTLQFERQTDPLHFASNMARLRNHFGIEYPMLNAGSNRNAGTALPMLNQVMGFPTTIILDRDHEVVEIHTGFSGPATGDIFLEYQKNFEALLDNLLIK